MRSWPRACALGLVLAGGCLSGCFGKNRAATPGDQLRSENARLTSENQSLVDQNRELRAKLLAESRLREGALTEDVLAALPRPGAIELGRLTGFVRDGGLRAYVVPRDGRGRFTQLVGQLTVTASFLPSANSGGEPSVLAVEVLPPSELREAYRSGLSGPAYVVDLGSPDVRGLEGQLVIEARFEDALSALTFDTTTMLKLPDPVASYGG